MYLVSCVKQKREMPAAARDLYIGTWFEKARAFVEKTGAPWFILSAEYGVVDPAAIVAPYEKTLNTMGVRERREWAARVADQMQSCLPPADRVVILAGQRYREFLMQPLRARYAKVDVPLERLRIGEQLSRLSAWLEDATPPL